MTSEIKKIDLMKTKEDRRDPEACYLFYGDAKEAGVRTGDQFQIDGGSEVFEVGEYTRWRNDINRGFSGFHCTMIN
ncbi:MAG: hypothetical protein GY841_04605 [FCB group bacterium]|nr:hypothetical protein [FCB group bacterium]